MRLILECQGVILEYLGVIQECQGVRHFLILVFWDLLVSGKVLEKYGLKRQ